MALRKIKLPPIVAGFIAKMRERPDSEHEMTANRVVILGIVMGYLTIASEMGNEGAQRMLELTAPVFAAHYLCAGALFAHICFSPAESPTRRILAIILDMASLSYGIHAGDEATTFLYPVYLWVIFGNGFRFGIPYLLAASVIGMVCFGLVIWSTPVWLDHITMSMGLLVGILMLPLYVATLIRKLSEAKSAAESSSRAKTMFLASVSHELRTPLNAVIGLSDMLGNDRELPRTAREMSRTISAAGRSLLGLINGLLDLSRMDVGQLPFVRRRFDLVRCLHDVRGMMSVQGHSRGLRVGLFIDPTVPRWLMGDDSRLTEVLTNLLGNGLKFTAQGHVSITVGVVRASEDRVTLRLSVVDTGIGIAREAQGRIWESFTQADDSIMSRFGGTGLGLSIVKRVVELQGGRIGVDSSPGEGSVFWFELPFDAPERGELVALELQEAMVLLSHDPAVSSEVEAVVPDLQVCASVEEALVLCIRPDLVLIDGAMPGAITAANDFYDAGIRAILIGDGQSLPDRDRAAFASSARPELLGIELPSAIEYAHRPHPLEAEKQETASRRLSILVAEDNRVNQKVIRLMLEQAGHDITFVTDGQQALDALQQRRFDIAIMDINMPILGGIEAVRRYRATAIKPITPIVALTADASPATAAACLEVGMVACMTKPIDQAQLLQLVHRHAHRHSPEDGKDDLKTLATLPSLPSVPSTTPAAPAPTPAISLDTLGVLSALGGPQFADELLTDFLSVADETLGGMASAIATCDAETCRGNAHGLSSAAGNVGAMVVVDCCRDWSGITADRVLTEGWDLHGRLARAVEDVRRAQADAVAALERELHGEAA